MSNLAQIRSQIDKANAAYYRTSQPIMTDEEYDKLVGELRKQCPTDSRLTNVGASVTTEMGAESPHEIPMGSLDNTDNGIAGFPDWYEGTAVKLNTEQPAILASLKVDGSSIRATYKAGELVCVATRGNGQVGLDVTANGRMFWGLPTTLPKPIDADVRGEAILFKEDFTTICERDKLSIDEISNPRNVGNGIINRSDGTDSHLIKYLAFNIHCDKEFATESEKFQYMQELGFKVVPNKLCQTPQQVHDFYSIVAGKRDTFPFEIDGIVITLDSLEYQKRFITKDIKTRLRPKYARAIKFPHKSSTTKLLGITLSIGHTGAIIPTANLEEVRVGGVFVSNALLNNWDEIERLGIAINDTVEVILSGDIIPKIIRCVEQSPQRAPIEEPKHCPVCGDLTTRERHGKKGAVTYCSNKECPEASFQKILHWIGSSKKGVGILGIGETMVRALWANGVLRDPSDLYDLTVESIQNIELEGGMRIGESRATMIVNNINSKRQLNLSTFLGSLGIDLLGRRRVEILREAAGGELDTLADWTNIEKMQKISVHGLGQLTRDVIVDGLQENLPLIQKLLDKGVVVGTATVTKPTTQETETPTTSTEPATTSDPTKKFSGLSFCFTGTRDGLEDVKSLGGTVKSGISKGLHFLVQKDPLSTSNKTQKAEEYGTRIIAAEYLQKAIAGEVNLRDLLE